ncbi:hypothetical protein ABIE65_005148 [Constrictibacter sp. MBR-5]|uniref:hypothetical protein n=1 Tax=Constrictibacter sp. MBR-5 TaxID=3156467 RepID=UPI00339425C2
MPIKLKFAEVTRSTSMSARQRTPRDVIVAALSEQITLAQATLRGETFTVERRVYKKGEKGKVTQAVKPRPWWFEADGKFFGEVRFGNGPVDLSGKNLTAFECGTALSDVVAIFEKLRDAVGAGEFDAQIAQAREKTTRKAAA